ncbi:MAG: hypothetical protein NTW21_15665 [Verrucomicrobia bacterium]|nr:hypothetical protein [Verrucomicrobiota bacterium]
MANRLIHLTDGQAALDYALRQRGMTHAHALRCHGQRGLNIIWKMSWHWLALQTNP